jgi:hypothetical protein
MKKRLLIMLGAFLADAGQSFTPFSPEVFI